MNSGSHPVGYRFPAEFEPQEAVWLSWPCKEASAPKTFSVLQEKFGEIAGAISRYEEVRINAPAAWHERILRSIAEHESDPGQVELFDHPTNDVWCRDHGPVFITHAESGKIALTDWPFNAWGGKFPPWNLDNAIPERIAGALEIPRFVSDLILEGGGIETNGRGTLFTTRNVLLNPNRHGGKQGKRATVEKELKAMLGVEQVVWFEGCLVGDDTDGHIDEFIRFVREDAVICMVEPDEADSNHRTLREIREQLKDVRTTDGLRIEINEVEMPPALEVDNWRLGRLPASYANFLILNSAVLVPTFGCPQADSGALERITACFPGREMVPIDSRALLMEGGALHCISMQQPR